MDQQIQTFINQYKGQTTVGDTEQNRGQCVGLVEVWLDTIGLNTPHLYGNAKDLLANADPAKFDIVYNNPHDLNHPSPGDVMVFDGSWGNGDGHTGLVVTATGTAFSLFEANDHTAADPTGACAVLEHASYSGVLGWLHPKVLSSGGTNVQTNGLPPNYDEIIGKATKYDLFVTAGFSDPTRLQELVKGLTTSRDLNQQLYQQEVQKNSALTGQISTLQTNVANEQGEVNDWKSKYDADEKHIIELNDQIKSLADTISSIKSESKDYAVQSLDAQHQADEAKQQVKQIAAQHEQQLKSFLQTLITVFWRKKV